MKWLRRQWLLRFRKPSARLTMQPGSVVDLLGQDGQTIVRVVLVRATVDRAWDSPTTATLEFEDLSAYIERTTIR